MFYLTRCRMKQNRGISPDGLLSASGAGTTGSSPRNSPYTARKRRLLDRGGGGSMGSLDANSNSPQNGGSTCGQRLLPDVVQRSPCFYLTPDHRRGDVDKWELVQTFDPQTKFDNNPCRPCGVAVTPSGDFVVADSNNRKIKVFDRERGLLGVECSIPSTQQEAFVPSAVTVLSCGKIVTTDSGAKRVKVFTKNGRYLTSFGSNLSDPRGVAANSRGQLIVVDGNTCQVLMYPNFSDRSIRLRVPEGTPTFSQPTDVAVGPNDDFVIADSGLNTIRYFNSHGFYVRDIPLDGNLEMGQQQQIVSPFGLGFTKSGSALVSNCSRNTVLSIDSLDNGETQCVLSQAKVTMPTKLCASPDDFVAVTEHGSSKIKIFKC